MIELLRKDKKFTWTESCEKNFQELKKRLTTAPMSTLPDIHHDFIIYCDAARQVYDVFSCKEEKWLLMHPASLNLMSKITLPMIWS
jgi:hypothetical protein